MYKTPRSKNTCSTPCLLVLMAAVIACVVGMPFGDKPSNLQDLADLGVEITEVELGEAALTNTANTTNCTEEKSAADEQKNKEASITNAMASMGVTPKSNSTSTSQPNVEKEVNGWVENATGINPTTAQNSQAVEPASSSSTVSSKNSTQLMSEITASDAAASNATISSDVNADADNSDPAVALQKLNVSSTNATSANATGDAGLSSPCVGTSCPCAAACPAGQCDTPADAHKEECADCVACHSSHSSSSSGTNETILDVNATLKATDAEAIEAASANASSSDSSSSSGTPTLSKATEAAAASASAAKEKEQEAVMQQLGVTKKQMYKQEGPQPCDNETNASNASDASPLSSDSSSSSGTNETILDVNATLKATEAEVIEAASANASSSDSSTEAAAANTSSSDSSTEAAAAKASSSDSWSVEMLSATSW